MKATKTIRTFRELVGSPVGQVGRTSKQEANDHINKNDLYKRFKKIVKELGGKVATRLLLNRMDQEGNYISNPTSEITEAIDIENPEKYIRDLGYKIKDVDYDKKKIEIEFFKAKDAQEAFEDLKDAGFMEDYNISVVNRFIEFIVL